MANLWKPNDYKKRRAIRTYLALVGNGAVDLNDTQSTLNRPDIIQQQKPKVLTDETTRLRGVATRLEHELSQAKQDLEDRVKVAAVNVAMLLSEIQKRQEAVRNVTAVIRLLQAELDRQNTAATSTKIVLPMPDAGDYLKQVDRVYKQTKERSPFTYGFVPSGFTVSEWNANEEYRVHVEEEERARRVQQAEFVAFTQAKRAYNRALHRQTQGADYRGNRNPLY